MKILGSAALILYLAGAWHNAAYAQSCNAGATTLAFGTYDPLAGSNTTTNATVAVTCSATISIFVSYTVTLSTGNGTYTQRKLLSGSNPLNYQIYKDSGYTQVWGDGTAGTSVNTGGYLLAILTPVTVNYTAYGRIPALQNAAVGSYGDTIIITVSY